MAPGPVRFPGSSPLARGLRGPDSAHGAGPRDHPRSRGVYAFMGRERSAKWGSSPLARGLRRYPHAHHPRIRIIPARAGFTGRAARQRPGRPDHPRSRGVYRPTDPSEAFRSGSSPLARGLRRRLVSRSFRTGIIPARAGFTEGVAGLLQIEGDHPRSRGVYPRGRPVGRVHRGSSPLARGLHHDHVRPLPVIGIIPARAGFTGDGRRAWGDAWDHPRSRGVYAVSRRPPIRLSGSSPLARGLRGPGRPIRRARRIIPARAGFTRCAVGAPSGSADHPRSRGVYPWKGPRNSRMSGSSPLARGLRGRTRRRLELRRIIPARAGFTARGAG